MRNKPGQEEAVLWKPSPWHWYPDVGWVDGSGYGAPVTCTQRNLNGDLRGQQAPVWAVDQQERQMAKGLGEGLACERH